MHLYLPQEKCQAHSFLAQRMNSDLLYDEGAFTGEIVLILSGVD